METAQGALLLLTGGVNKGSLLGEGVLKGEHMLKKIVFVLILLSVFAVDASAKKMVMLTGPYAPFSVNKGLRVDGIAIDTFEVIMKMTGMPFEKKKVKYIEWDTAVKVGKAMPNCVLLGIPRTPEVEEKFKWVGPIDFPHYVLIGKAGKQYELGSVAEASQYSIGTVRGSDASDYFVEKGLPKSSFVESTSYVQPLLQLKKGEVDLVAFNDMEVAFLMRRMSIDVREFDLAWKSKGIPLYFAFGKATDDATIKLLNNALATYKKPSSQWDSAYDKNTRKYLPRGVVD